MDRKHKANAVGKDAPARGEPQGQEQFLAGLARAFGGALLFALPLLMTMEMLVIVSLVIMHAFVYSMQFRGQALIPPNTSFGSVFVRFTVVGYAIASDENFSSFVRGCPNLLWSDLA